MTAPAPDAEDTTVELLALADLGHCEEDGSVTFPGSYANPVSLLPTGTDQEVQAEARTSLLHCILDSRRHFGSGSCVLLVMVTGLLTCEA